jgi:hypothetical protein
MNRCGRDSLAVFDKSSGEFSTHDTARALLKTLKSDTWFRRVSATANYLAMIRIFW